MAKFEIVDGPFALVSSGNTSSAYLVDGDDIQARANAALDWYWSNFGTVPATVHTRGVTGFGVAMEGQSHLMNVYPTHEEAVAAMGRMRANLTAA